MKLDSGQFAVVPKELISSRKLKPSEKLILTHCLARYQTKTESGVPWTFSTPNMAIGTGLSERTIRRHLPKLLKQEILKLYGTMEYRTTKDGEKLTYEVYSFVPPKLETFLISAEEWKVVPHSDKMSAKSSDKLTDKLSDKTPPIIEDNKREDGKKEDDKINFTGQSVLNGSEQVDCGGVLDGLSTSARSAPAATQCAVGSSSADGDPFEQFFKKKDAIPVLGAAAVIQRPAGGNANKTATNDSTGHSANSASGTSATSGGPRGDLPPAVAEHAEWLVADWKKHARFTEASVEIMADEMWKQLNEIKDWDLGVSLGFHPLQTVINIHEQVQKKFGVYL